jgi:2-polyprenyl-6-methoxyphenol hydroxylase-like FAD-dependent oxidoreductase
MTGINRVRTADILIVGAGIGGLTAALALHAQGIRATVLETVPRLRPLGVGINIQPFAVAELAALGLSDALAASAIPTRENLHLDDTGTLLWVDPRGQAAGHRYPQYSIHRGELQTLLLAAVRDRLGPDAVRTGVRLHSFVQRRSGVRAHTRDRGTGTVTAYEADALIGADGLHSTVRAQLHPTEGPPIESGVHMWRGLTDLDGFLDGRTMILASDDQATRLVAYPVSAQHAVKGRALVNWVCLVRTCPPAGCGDADWTRRGSLLDILPHYRRWDFDRLNVTGLLSGSRQILQYPMVDRDPLSSWGHGRVTLLGDAAHPMYPLAGEGASQAIADAAVLSAELGRGTDVISALHRYEADRNPATTSAVTANRDREVVGRTWAATVSQPSSDRPVTCRRPPRGRVTHHV